MSDAEITKAETIEKFGAEEVARLEGYAAALVQERKAMKRKAVKLDLVYSLQTKEGKFLWID
jgi:hypothetical protein